MQSWTGKVCQSVTDKIIFVLYAITMCFILHDNGVIYKQHASDRNSNRFCCEPLQHDYVDPSQIVKGMVCKTITTDIRSTLLAKKWHISSDFANQQLQYLYEIALLMIHRSFPFHLCSHLWNEMMNWRRRTNFLSTCGCVSQRVKLKRTAIW